MDLTQDSFDRLLIWLHPDMEEAGKISVKIRSDITRKFSSHGASLPEKWADVTIDRVAQKLVEIAETYKGEREPYFHRVAYYVLLESFAKHVDEVELTDDLPLVAPDDIENVELEYTCLEKCIEGLSAQKQNLIRNYYQGDKGVKIRRRQELASTFELELPALRIKALRIRQDLKGCIIQCLQGQQR